MSGSYWCQSTDTTTTTYTVTARRDQAERWEAAASADGLRGVGSWLAETADAHLRERAQTGQTSALPWFQDRFRVLVTDTTARPEVAHEIEVRTLEEVGEVLGIGLGTVKSRLAYGLTQLRRELRNATA